MPPRRIATDPPWRQHTHLTGRQLPAGVRPWLLDDGSLTGRLIQQDRGGFAVRRLGQGWQTPLPSERRLLGLQPRQLALVREVLLLLSGEPVVFARSVFPFSSLSGSLAHLRKLQNRSLGEILFGHPGIRRSPFELAYLGGQSDNLPAQQRQAIGAWGRRCRFELEGKSLLVSEVFLHNFVPWPARLPIHRTRRGLVSAAFRPPTK